MKILSLIFVAFLFIGCVSTITETRTVHPDGTYTVESQEVTEPAGEPWVGVGTPWVYYNTGWYYNGLLYGYYGNLGWWPWGYYPNSYIVRNNIWYNNNWNGWYHRNPSYHQNFHQKYRGGHKYSGPTRNAPYRASPWKSPQFNRGGSHQGGTGTRKQFQRGGTSGTNQQFNRGGSQRGNASTRNQPIIRTAPQMGSAPQKSAPVKNAPKNSPKKK